MRLPDVGLIAADTTRSRCYVQALIQADLIPGHVLMIRDPKSATRPGQNPSGAGGPFSIDGFSFDVGIPIERTLRGMDVECGEILNPDINSPEAVRAITTRADPVWIFSGFGGQILKDALKTGKKFLHVHGGYLPDYKGSTTNYFSLLERNSCGASALFLTGEIDSGPVLARRMFPPPADRTLIDYVYDPALRAVVLVDAIRKYARAGSWEYELKENTGGETFMIMHPLLRHIAILART